MANVHDVAAYILAKKGRMSTMKLQKLVYYSQAWSLAWENRPMFPETIEAWAKGPVVRELYQSHRGYFEVARWSEGDGNCLTPSEKNVVDRVLAYYGDKSADWLSTVTHKERPWRDARAGVSEGARSERIIDHESMRSYYSSL